MRLRIAVVAAAALTLVGGAPAHGGRDRCDFRGTRTVAENSRVRVFFEVRDPEERVFSCVRASGELRALDGPREGRFAYAPPALDLSGHVVAYAREFASTEGPGETVIAVLDARRAGENLDRRPDWIVYKSGPGTDPKIGAVVARANGAVAWIACPRTSPPTGETFADPAPECTAPGGDNRVYRLRSRSRRKEELDRGIGIDPRSLRVRGDRVSWVRDGRRRSAALR